MSTLMFLAPILVAIIALIAFSIRIFREYERGLMFTLGRFTGVKGPGLVLMLPYVQQMVRVDLRTMVLDVPPQDVISRDNVSVKVNAVVYFRVVAPERAIIEVEDFRQATSQLAQTTLRNVLGQSDLDELLAHRERINQKLQQIIDEATEPWGIKVGIVEVEKIVEVGEIAPDDIHLPGIYVHRLVLNATPEKRIEKRTISEGAK